VVVPVVEEYEKLRDQERSSKPSLIEHILAAPKRPLEIPDDEELSCVGGGGCVMSSGMRASMC
jgi:hypothetical protein